MALQIIREQLWPPGRDYLHTGYDDVALSVAVWLLDEAAQHEADRRHDIRHIATTNEHHRQRRRLSRTLVNSRRQHVARYHLVLDTDPEYGRYESNSPEGSQSWD